MPRPRRTDNAQQKIIYLPKHVVDCVDFLHTDSVTGKPKHGAFSHYIEGLIRRDLHTKGIDLDQFRISQEISHVDPL